ncbi:MAG: nitrous oxide reductase family maturation protein NosD [Hyphomicrobiales bacterium]
MPGGSRFLASLAVAALGAAAAVAAPSPTAEIRQLQPLLDAAEENEVLLLEPGIYAGPVVVTKPMLVDGGGAVTIDGGGKGTVVTLQTDNATIRGVRIIGSGESHNDIDAGVRVEGDSNNVKDLVIEDCLFGVDLQQSDSNVVRRNLITSKADSGLGVKGDAVRLWYSRYNVIEENTVSGSRDMVVWYSEANTLARNRISGGRYGLHFMYSKYNLVEGNTIDGNSVGIFLMYSDDIVVRGNRLFKALGPTGVGVGLKETSNVEITDNEILYNATGIYLDVSPFQPETTNRILRNEIAFNSTGVLFLNDWIGNIFEGNDFSNNIRQVSVNEYAGAARNTWESNHWDDYEGFDRDHDGVGDKPYTMMVYADRLWMDVPNAAFFKGTPLLSALDLLERLAPFTEPIVMLTDAKPHVLADVGPRKDAAQDAKKERVNPFGLESD